NAGQDHVVEDDVLGQRLPYPVGRTVLDHDQPLLCVSQHHSLCDGMAPVIEQKTAVAAPDAHALYVGSQLTVQEGAGVGATSYERSDARDTGRDGWADAGGSQGCLRLKLCAHA